MAGASNEELSFAATLERHARVNQSMLRRLRRRSTSISRRKPLPTKWQVPTVQSHPPDLFDEFLTVAPHFATPLSFPPSLS